MKIIINDSSHSIKHHLLLQYVSAKLERNAYVSLYNVVKAFNNQVRLNSSSLRDNNNN